MGLRELKKEQTRQLIAESAWRLFVRPGFDQVTVAEVAREAQVAEATVYNYFGTKEDLFYSRLEAFGTRLAEAVAARPDGEQRWRRSAVPCSPRTACSPRRRRACPGAETGCARSAS